MHIAFAASECVPFSKTGGLADVVGALPRALAGLGHQATVYVPLYRHTKLTNPRTVVRSITVPFDDEYRFCSVVDGGKIEGVQYYFIDYPQFFDRDALYGTSVNDYSDNAERFALFSRAVLEASKVLGAPDIFHCHDWQSALVPVLLKTLYAGDPALQNVPSVFTIHNIGYQGLFPADTLPLLMLPWDLFTLTKMEFFGKVNFLKGALVFADFISTVSRRYSLEIQTSEYGFGLEGVLRQRSNTVTGILNGVDYEEWNPETDRYIVANYSSADPGGKAANKAELLRVFGLPVSATSTPLIGMVSRLAAQKGLDLVQHAADRLMREDLMMVVLGSGDKPFEELMKRLSKLYPAKFAARIAYDNEVAHKIEAGADLFLMPSRYEPCGLNQMYSLRYGTVPIVHGVGGLDDTIENFDPVTRKGTGFKFTEYTAEALLASVRQALSLSEALLASVRQALSLYKEPRTWQQLMRNGMAKDFSWTVSAREYVRMYEKARQIRHVV